MRRIHKVLTIIGEIIAIPLVILSVYFFISLVR